MQLTCLHCRQPVEIAEDAWGTTINCPHCHAAIALPAAEAADAIHDSTGPATSRWWEGSISMLVSIVFHMALVLILALWTYGGAGMGGPGEEVLIGQMPGEQLTEQAATELSSESFEEEVASASEFDTLEEIEPGSSNVMDSTNELLALAAPSASAGTSGDLQFDVAISGSGGSGGDWDGMIQSLRRNGLDIVIVFDSTGSMGGEIDQVKRQIERIGSALIKLVPKARISLCTYRDENDEYIVRGTPLTGDIQQLATFLDGVSAAGGGDTPEAVLAGMSWGASRNQFNSRARKVMLIFGDAPPHERELSACIQLASDFRRQQAGIVSTVTCRSNERLPAFIHIAQAGGGEAFLTSDQRQIMTQLMVLVFGSKHRSKVLEAFRLLER